MIASAIFIKDFIKITVCGQTLYRKIWKVANINLSKVHALTLLL